MVVQVVKSLAFRRVVPVVNDMVIIWMLMNNFTPRQAPNLRSSEDRLGFNSGKQSFIGPATKVAWVAVVVLPKLGSLPPILLLLGILKTR